jgi:hypothetical protein
MLVPQDDWPLAGPGLRSWGVGLPFLPSPDGVHGRVPHGPFPVQLQITLVLWGGPRLA